MSHKQPTSTELEVLTAQMNTTLYNSVSVMTQTRLELKYFTEDQLLMIEKFCNEGNPSDKNVKFVISVMEFLSNKGFITGRQKGAVLGLACQNKKV